MKTEDVSVKSKKVEIEGSPFPYEAPETMEEALAVDGEEKILSLYLQQRKIRFMDAKRKEVTGGGIPKTLLNMIKAKNLSEEKLLQLADALDLDLSDVMPGEEGEEEPQAAA